MNDTRDFDTNFDPAKEDYVASHAKRLATWDAKNATRLAHARMLCDCVTCFTDLSYPISCGGRLIASNVLSNSDEIVFGIG